MGRPSWSKIMGTLLKDPSYTFIGHQVRQYYHVKMGVVYKILFHFLTDMNLRILILVCTLLTVCWSHDLMLYQTCHMMLSSIMLVTWYNSLSDSSHDAFFNYAGHMMRYTMYMYMCIFTYHIAFCPKHVIGLPYKCLLK